MDMDMKIEKKTYRNILLILMIIVYLIPINYIYYNFKLEKSLCSIITNSKYKTQIFFYMLIMGIITILYEVERNDNKSLLIIILLLIGIYGIITTKRKSFIHYIFSAIVFFSILVFMALYCWRKNNIILYLLGILEILILISIRKNINGNIFYQEAAFVINFAIFYIYLHYIESK